MLHMCACLVVHVCFYGMCSVYHTLCLHTCAWYDWDGSESIYMFPEPE